mmetsp:Transcript_8563/g.22125  ORF Transcript_8563/g.22125 Transcript_8563/m.22125 type:complete len:235 (+) Transcript_8563:614-1318(+)
MKRLCRMRCRCRCMCSRELGGGAEGAHVRDDEGQRAAARIRAADARGSRGAALAPPRAACTLWRRARHFRGARCVCVGVCRRSRSRPVLVCTAALARAGQGAGAAEHAASASVAVVEEAVVERGVHRAADARVEHARGPTAVPALPSQGRSKRSDKPATELGAHRPTRFVRRVGAQRAHLHLAGRLNLHAAQLGAVRSARHAGCEVGSRAALAQRLRALCARRTHRRQLRQLQR